MTCRRFIFVDQAAKKLYASPEYNGSQEDYATGGKCLDSCGVAAADLLRLFQVRDLSSFQSACKEAQSRYRSAPADESAAEHGQESQVSELALDDLSALMADELLFALDGRLIAAPRGWDGTIHSLYEYVNNTVQVAQALNALSGTQAPGSLVYSQVVRISAEELAVINGYLNAQTQEEFQDEDHTIIHTARFPDGKEMDIKCCGCKDDPSWTEAVLFDVHGCELACTEVCEEYEGSWELEYDGVMYYVNVIADKADEEPPGPVQADQEGICPVCGAAIQYEGENIIDDDGGVFPWTCPGCGATGKEGYTRCFDQHYDVCSEDGKPVSWCEE